MNYEQTIQRLYDLRWFGAKLGLENTRRLSTLSGNPQEKLRFIHVAGTNGKGSVCAMLESIYRHAGLRTGMFTSPHLVHFNERIQVNRSPISEADVIRLVQELEPLLASFEREHHPTFFEAVTVMALRYFLEQKCDLVIWETGLGGRLDATNIVHPLASVITTIQYDHEKWLGNTLTSIAFEKAGIIKPGVPAITGAKEREALDVIKATAKERGSPLHRAAVTDPESLLLRRIKLPLSGAHQLDNAAVAARTVQVLQPAIPVDDAAISSGLEQVNWPGRLQTIVREDGQVVLLDAAHNPAGAETLAKAVLEKFGSENACFILGILHDKDYRTMCKLLAPLASRVLIVPVHSERAASTAELAAACASAKPGIKVTECDSLEGALASTRAEENVVIAGSLYLAGEALELLGLATGGRQQERRLNEYSAGHSKAV